jgi:hypothetical protein
MHTHTYTHACTLEHTKTLSLTHTYIQPGISKCKTIKIVPMILILHDHAQSKFFARVVGCRGSVPCVQRNKERTEQAKRV